MPGDGTKTDTTTSNSPPARLLDVTRLGSRAGRRMTGIDRVEYAYVRELSADHVPCFGLYRSRFGFLLINPDQLWAVVQRCIHGKRRIPDMLSLLDWGKTWPQKEAEAEMRRVAIARCSPRGLAQMLERHLPSGFSYVNVGHSNLSEPCLYGVGIASGITSVLIHDVIPIDFPQFQRPGTPEKFGKKLKTVQKYADLIIYNSYDTQARAEQVLGAWGEVPKGLVSYLGTDEPSELPDAKIKTRRQPYFVCVGTIEPRKNVGFLLDLWDQMGSEAPGLCICGARGWNNEAVFRRLDALPLNAPVQEFSNLDDTDLRTLIAGSAGLLFPSHAEGFGLPAVEAARLGVPLICNDLPVFREILDNIPIYASVKDKYLWINEIRGLASATPGKQEQVSLGELTWNSHFKTVLSMI